MPEAPIQNTNTNLAKRKQLKSLHQIQKKFATPHMERLKRLPNG